VDAADCRSRHLRLGREPGGGILGDQVGVIRSLVYQRVRAIDDELIRVGALATRVACQRMTPRYLKALSDSIEQVCSLPAMFAWDRKATAYAEIVNLLVDAAADPVLALLVRNVPGRLYDLIVMVGPAADNIIAGSRRRLLALIRARDADGAGREMEEHVEGLSWMVERRCVSVQEAALWTANKIAMVDLDYVVVGAGAVGCPLANRLPEDPDNQARLLGCWVHGAMVEGWQVNRMAEIR
jgi:hypothetical protein